MSGTAQIIDFDDGKDPGALRTIGEVAQAVGIRQHVLRYWEEQFRQLRPIKRSGGRRYYRPEDVELIVEIDRLVHREGYTLRGAAKAITDKTAGEKPLPVASEPAADPECTTTPSLAAESLRRLVEIRNSLAKALAAA